MTPIGRGPAPADHRRPQDRQDRGLRRHDHQPEAVLGDRRRRSCRSAASTSRSARRAPRSPVSGSRWRTPARWRTPRSWPRPASDSAGFKWLAPYTGSAIGQHWMYQGKHVLIIFDDLSKQAEAYRAISLLLRRPPGREAYPGDVFYLHSRLLERCAKLSDELGAGSMTGLPIIETKAGDVSAYIPTNVISITDGQCFLQGDLFNSGVRPGRQRRHLGLPGRRRRAGQGHAQGVRHAASGPVRLPRARGVRRLRLRPGRGVEAGAGPRLPAGRAAQAAAVQPVSRCEEQVVSIWAGTRGHLDRVPVQDIRRFEAEFLQYLRHAPGSPLEAITDRARPVRRRREGAARRRWRSSPTPSPRPRATSWAGRREVKPMDESEVGQEKVQVRRAGCRRGRVTVGGQTAAIRAGR